MAPGQGSTYHSPELAKKVALAMMQLADISIEAFRSQSRGWTIPLDYHEVHDCLRQLQVAPYTNFGKITLGQLYQQYKIWFFTSATLLLCIFSTIVLVLKLNGKLKTALVNLDLEHQQRAQIIDDLDEFKLTLDQTLDCVFMFSADDFRFIYVNQGAVEHIGYSREELLTMPPLDFKPDASEAEFRSMIAPLIDRTSSSLTYPSTNQRKDGTLIPVEVFMQHITPPHKKSRFVAIVRDITIRLEKKLKEKYYEPGYTKNKNWPLSDNSLQVLPMKLTLRLSISVQISTSSRKLLRIFPNLSNSSAFS
ncbi:MAG: PAS domain S-box-containing protein [Desulforhopalus sp.]|jgi:PAS domain S-box-containing protein